jgi:hypothetical protein
MDTTRTLKAIIAGALLSGTVAVASLGLAAGTAQAAPGFAPLARWCPGDPLTSSMQRAGWDLSVCHDYYFGPGPDGRTHLIEGQFVPPACPPSILPCL